MLESLPGGIYQKFLAKLVAVGPLQQSARLNGLQSVQCAKYCVSLESHGALVTTSASENQSVMLPKGVAVGLRHSDCRLLVKERPLVGFPQEAMVRLIPVTLCIRLILWRRNPHTSAELTLI
jgi:hypothetical protein